MRRILSIIMVWTFCVLIHAQEKKVDSVVYNGKKIQLEENAGRFQSLKSAGGVDYVIMQFYELPNKEEKQALSNRGIKLNEYLGNNSYLVELGVASLKSSTSSIRSIVSLNGIVKISEELQKGEFPKCAMKPDHHVELVISFFRSAGEDQIKNDLEAIEATDVRISPFFERLTCVLPTGNVDKLNKLPWLKYAAAVAPEFETFDMQASRQMGVSVINGYAGADMSLKGEGINIGVWDGDVENHYDFQGRVTQREYEYHETSHGIHVSGIMAGAGIIDPITAGVAPKATMETWNFNVGSNKMTNGEEMYQSARDYGIVITQNSYGIPHAGGSSWFYLSNDVELDKVAYDFPHLLHVFAAGNSRGSFTYETVSHSAKNIVAVGAIDQFNNMTDFSSWGPVHDGRLVPHVCANGVDAFSCSYYNDYTDMTGTSQATPVVSGIAAQLYELYKTKNGGENPKASLIKAALCNTAHDLGTKGPDFSFGFGSVVASEAANLIEKEQYVVDKVANNEQKKISIFVPKGVSQVKFMLSWTDPEAAEWTANALINDLDLRVNFKGSEYLPLILNPTAPVEPATPGEDHLNNIEQVIIETPTPGYYDVYVTGSSIAVPDQEYALVYAFDKDNINLLSPVGGEIFAPFSSVVVYWSAPDTNNEPFTIQLSKDGGKTYTTLGTAPADKRIFTWKTGNTAFGNAKLRVIAGKYFDASNKTFSVIGRPYIKAVNPELPVSSIEWRAVSGANAYNVYKLQEGVPVLMEQVTETSYTLESRNIDEDNWYAVSAVNTEDKIESLRSKALKLNPISTVAEFPFSEDFEGAELSNITLKQPVEGQLAIGYNTDRNTKFLKFEGTTSGTIYTAKGTLDEIWAQNTDFIATAKLSVENTDALSSLLLAFDLKQTFCFGENHNLLKVYVNGELVTDVLGTNVFRAETPAYDRSRTRYFDLTKFVGTKIEVEFRGMCHYPTGVVQGAAQGDVIDIDNIKLYKKPLEDIAVLDVEFPKSGLNLGEETIHIKLANLGSETISNTDVKYILYRNEEAVSTVQEKTTSTVGSMETSDHSFVTKVDLSTEDAKYYVVAEAIGKADADKSNNSYQSYSSYNYGNIVPMAYNGTSGRKDVSVDGLVFTDGGTRVFNYPDKTRSSYSFFPEDINKKVKISFSELNLEKDYDYLYLFAGSSATGTPIAILNGGLEDMDQTEFISTGIYGVLTVLFVSDEAVNESGWVANITMADNPNALDIGIEAITNPVQGREQSNDEVVGVTVSNYGTTEVSNYTVGYTINDGEPVEMVFTTPLRSGGSKYINFPKREDFSVFGKEYKIEVYANLDGDMVAYNNKATTTISSDYPSANGLGFGLYIENVTLGEINLSSGDNMYENHSDLSTTMEYGNSYHLYVTKNDAVGTGKYWIDWNYDGTFSEDESFIFDSSEKTTLKALITPPNTAVAGKKRLRIRIATFGEMEPSGFVISGEVEDYTINLTGTPPTVDVAVNGLDVSNVINEGAKPIGVIVSNGSTTAQSFNVTLNIESEYAATKLVDNLMPAESTTVVFDDVVLSKGKYEITAQVDLAADELLTNNTYTTQVEAMPITPVYAYSVLGSGSVSAGPFKFNLENVTQTNQILNKNGFYPYCGVMAVDKWLVQSLGGTLSSINKETGEVEYIGASGYLIRDMAYDLKNDILYGRKMSDDLIPAPEVYIIDQNTGTAKQVGSISVPTVQTIACDISGKMYGVDNTGMLYAINTSSWEAMPIGATGILLGSSPHPALFFDHNNGELYMASCHVTESTDDYEIRKINVTTGKSELVKLNNDLRRTLCYAVEYNNDIAKSLAKITAFSMVGSSIEGEIDQEEKVIHVKVPVGADISQLAVTFSLSPGASAHMAGKVVAPNDMMDLSEEASITVVSMNGLVSNDYKIIVEDPIHTEALLLSYKIEDEVTMLKDFEVMADVDASANFKALTVEFELSEKAKAYVGNTMLVSGVSKLDHEKPFVLKVVAEDGVGVNYYVVEISRNANNQAEINYFLLQAGLNTQLVNDLAGIGTADGFQITGVPSGVSNLIPSFGVSAGAEVLVANRIQTSGVDDVDFEGGVEYVVVSEDGSTSNTYIISIDNLTTDLIKVKKDDIIAYPNPAKDFINITNTGKGEVSIYNTLGGLMLKQDVYQKNAKVQISNLLPGVYILKFKRGRSEKTCKIKLIP